MPNSSCGIFSPDEYASRSTIHRVDTVDSCSHEVAVPSGSEFVPLEVKPGPPAREYPFVLDPFQREAILCIENEQSVLVSAHTSAGKTVRVPSFNAKLTVLIQ